jgi:hypothetical protein
VNLERLKRFASQQLLKILLAHVLDDRQNEIAKQAPAQRRTLISDLNEL